jgi:O-methyltransferase
MTLMKSLGRSIGPIRRLHDSRNELGTALQTAHARLESAEEEIRDLRQKLVPPAQNTSLLHDLGRFHAHSHIRQGRLMNEHLYATPQQPRFEDCDFYHTMDIPGHGLVKGQWDLRENTDRYFGDVNFGGRRVLEIGPASGFLSMEMEKRGADVVSLEVQDDPGWDFVPQPNEILEPMFPLRRAHMAKIKASYWFNHQAHNSKARLLYADVYNIPDIGRFDIALMGSVLLHTKAPLQIVEQCAKRANTVIITDLVHPEIEGMPVARLLPTAENKYVDTWWQFSSTFFIQFLGVMGFEHFETTTHEQPYGDTAIGLFTIVARR